ncbi:MAG: hypothetical protein K1X28_08185 [Parachlamydiales bacterium]|nr:hypothetical protein [Parachlamydiales bacterium]
MSRLHICNTFFEKELETSSTKPLAEWMRSHPIVMQLQFLPLLYAGPNDHILVSDLPDNPDPRLCLIDNPPKKIPIEHWGPSRAIAAWAQKHRIPYSMPDWEWVRTINSKVFSFTESPKLPWAKLLNTQEEVREWIEKTPDPKVLKTPFGTAGRGHDHHPNVKRLYKTPIIGEPWVQRVQDFSTQWRDGKLIGVTVFENEPNGTYKGTYAGEVEKWALQEHLSVAKPLIEKLQYSGNIGIDAFIYLWEGKKRVHPVVEINARKTMSWVALQMPEKRLYYTRSLQGLLPDHLGKIAFSRNITCT